MLCQIRKHCIFLIMLIVVTTMNVVVLYCLVISFLINLAPNVEGTCDSIPIEIWGGSPSGHVANLQKPVELVVVTHTVTGECDTDQECERISNAIRTRHIRQGLNDIGLSFLVGGNGKIYDGAGWRIGSHTLGYNEKSISLSFIGDFREKLPLEAALSAAEHFLGCLLNTRYLSCEYILVGHRQLVTTASPGDALQNFIQTWPHWTSNITIRPN